MPREKMIMACAMVLLSMLVLTTIPASAVAATAPVVLLQENAEQQSYDEWNVRWQRFDLNKDVVNGAVNEDSWCRSAHNLRDSAQRHLRLEERLQQPLTRSR